MKLTRARTVLAAGMLAASGTAASLVLSATPASAASTHVVLVQCGGGTVRPSGYDPGCMPSQSKVRDLRWVSWSSTAYGGGTMKINDCEPSCAQGRFVSYPVRVVLWRARPRPGHAGQSYFTRVTWIFTGKRPPGQPVSPTFTLPASGN